MFDYGNKHVVVVGGATGMGAAAAQAAARLGAQVTVLDVAQVSFADARVIALDLRDPASTDAAVALIDDPIDALFSCAGVADGTRGLTNINFIGQRRLIEGLVGKGALPAGSAIGVISSTAGAGWQQDLSRIVELLGLDDWQAQQDWVASNRTDNPYTNSEGYLFSKQAICAYVARRAFGLLKQGIRINAILPGPTDTPLARANADLWLGFASDYRDAAGVPHLTPEEMANILLFLCSPLASGLTGENIIVDRGYTASSVSGAFVSAAMAG